MEAQSLWLSDDKQHINVTELDTVIKTLTPVVSWDVKELILLTSLQAVYGSLGTLLENTKKREG